MELIANLERSRTARGLTPENLENLEKIFNDAVGDKKEIDLQSFKKIVQSKNVDFFWLNRNQCCFEWFVNLLSELEVEQAQLKEKDRFLDIHMYITSALHRTDMKAVGLQMALDLLYKKEKRDLITGLKSRTQPGRPDWNKVRSGLCIFTTL
ncbi:NADPH oxidase 5 [Araneus ventricosus]|uniref:NADPH oxidase 5 n=1 Tax=Araneus ventricosus TaxID=182803 RepID=A0A4Y2UK62_ARAVE|nr:NADPH oxidase 5 [Araneus ventricosus]